ncbi:MAG: type II toxin-antitoxin system HicB family antitoxin [Coxiellaceae bacterium]|nr:MAG: type II toxin-antitoxin system HicB family antitoxin [Coxiellaceae bacterium]
MKDMMHYKNYYGSVHFDDKDIVFYGKIEFIRALVSYEATTAKDLLKAFKDAVDDYLAMCHEQGITPEIPFKGSLNVRLGSELHKRVAIAASLKHISINKFIADTLEDATEKVTKRSNLNMQHNDRQAQGEA